MQSVPETDPEGLESPRAEGGPLGEDATAPDSEETPVSSWNASPFARLFLFRGLSSSSSSSSSIFSPSVQLFVFSDRVSDLRQEIRYLYSRGAVLLMVSIAQPAQS